MSYLEIDSQFRIKTNEAKYSSQGGLLYASCFEYSDVTKSLISNINRKNYVYLDGSKIFIIPNSFEIYSSKVQGTDYFHTIITRKNCVEVDESGDEYIFCIIYGKEVDNTEDSTDKLFEKLNKLSSVPLLREWMPYIINKMTEFGGIFHNCHSNIGFPNCVRIAAVTVYNKWLVSIIQRGLQSGDLTIDNCKKNSPTMENIVGLNGYLENFNEILTRKIQQSFIPNFTPQVDSYDQTLIDLDEYSEYMSRFKYYPAQMSVIQAVSNTLKNQKSAFITAEMGSGKTSLAIASILTHNADKKLITNVILCLGHLVKKWKYEIERLASISEVIIIDNLKTLKKIESKIKGKKRRNLWLILSKDIAKLGRVGKLLK